MTTSRSNARNRRNNGKRATTSVASPPPTNDKSRATVSASASKNAISQVSSDSDDSEIMSATSAGTGTGAAEMQQIMVALDGRMKRKQAAVQKRLQAEFNKRMKKAGSLVQSFIEESRSETAKKLQEYSKLVHSYSAKCQKMVKAVEESIGGVEAAGSDLIAMLTVEQPQSFKQDVTVVDKKQRNKSKRRNAAAQLLERLNQDF